MAEKNKNGGEGGGFKRRRNWDQLRSAEILVSWQAFPPNFQATQQCSFALGSPAFSNIIVWEFEDCGLNLWYRVGVRETGRGRTAPVEPMWAFTFRPGMR